MKRKLLVAAALAGVLAGLAVIAAAQTPDLVDAAHS